MTAFNKDFSFSYVLMTVIMKQHHKRVHLQEEIQGQAFPRLLGNDVLGMQHGHADSQRCE